MSEIFNKQLVAEVLKTAGQYQFFSSNEYVDGGEDITVSYKHLDLMSRLTYNISEYERIAVDMDHNEVTIDLHGMHHGEFEKFMKKISRTTKKGDVLLMVHGHNNGTMMKDLLRTRKSFGGKNIAWAPVAGNPGATYISFI